jgi:hypothetical protein
VNRASSSRILIFRGEIQLRDVIVDPNSRSLVLAFRRAFPCQPPEGTLRHQLPSSSLNAVGTDGS